MALDEATGHRAIPRDPNSSSFIGHGRVMLAPGDVLRLDNRRCCTAARVVASRP